MAAIPTYRVPSVELAFRIAEAVSEAPEGLTFTEIWHQVQCPKATAFMVVAELKALQVLRQQGRRYLLGPTLVRLGSRAQGGLDLRTLAEPVMQQLVEQTGFTSHLGILDGDQLVYIAKVENEGFVRFSSYVGMTQPFYLSSLGKAIAAFLPEAALETVLERCTFTVRTRNTVANAEAFRKEAARIRAQGFAVEDEENEEGVRCVGAPIFDRTGQVVAAVSVTAISAQLVPASFESVGALVRQAAFTVSELLGWRRQAAEAAEGPNQGARTAPGG